MEIKEILKSMEVGGGRSSKLIRLSFWVNAYALCKSLTTAFSIQKAITKVNLY